MEEVLKVLPKKNANSNTYYLIKYILNDVKNVMDNYCIDGEEKVFKCRAVTLKCILWLIRCNIDVYGFKLNTGRLYDIELFDGILDILSLVSAIRNQKNMSGENRYWTEYLKYPSSDKHQRKILDLDIDKEIERTANEQSILFYLDKEGEVRVEKYKADLDFMTDITERFTTYSGYGTSNKLVNKKLELISEKVVEKYMKTFPVNMGKD